MKVGVIGAGTMGRGIAQAFAQAGLPVIVKGINQAEIENAQTFISKALQGQVSKGKMEQAAADATMANLSFTTEYAPMAETALVVEAVFERMEVKKELFAQLDAICPPDTIFASNTSSLSITEIAASVKRKEKFIGMHFFNPAPVMKLVEVIKGQLTNEATAQTVTEMALRIGKTPVTVNEAPGFVVNRILIPLVNEAVGILAEGVATKEEIDSAMKLGAGHPMGPLTLGDLIGLDVCLAIMEVLHSEFGEDKYRPHPLLRKMVRANLLGRKTGEGFYKY